MKRCCFIGLDEVMEVKVRDKLTSELDKLVQSGDRVEFWFYMVNRIFYQLALSRCIMMKTKYPEKDIEIVRVYDPEADKDDWYSSAYNTFMPPCIPSRFVPAEVDVGKGRGNENWNTQRLNKVERWAIRQCDLVLAYYYPSLADSTNTQVEYAYGCEGKTVIPLYDEETDAFAVEQIMGLDDRTRTVMLMLKDGSTQKAAGTAVGVSVGRVGQIVHKAGYAIHKAMVKRMFQSKERETEHRCALVGLNNDATAFQLVVFESLLEYLQRYYRIKEFWIDQSCCDTAYGAILARYAARPSIVTSKADRAAKVFLTLPEEENGEWEAVLKRYVPPFTSVINIAADHQDWHSLCSEVIRQCDCIITDLSSPDAPYIQELCAHRESAFMFDLSNDNRI